MTTKTKIEGAAKDTATTTNDTNHFEASGAPAVELHGDHEHPALDADPRANTSDEQNRIDFNDPSF